VIMNKGEQNQSNSQLILHNAENIVVLNAILSS
jgi:hypothetical protein